MVQRNKVIIITKKIWLRSGFRMLVDGLLLLGGLIPFTSGLDIELKEDRLCYGFISLLSGK